MSIWLWWVMLIVFNHSLLWHYYIAMLIMFCSSQCDKILCPSHHIVKLWSSNYDEVFFVVTLWCWNRFFTIQNWVIFITLWHQEMFVSLQYWSMFVTFPHWVLCITLKQWFVVYTIVMFGNVCHKEMSLYVHRIATWRYVLHIMMAELCSSHCDICLCL